MELPWIMRLSRIREVVSHFVADLPLSGSGTNAQVRERELEQLAYAILEFGKMQHQLRRHDTTIVDETEVAFRFRETKRAITKALKLLEARGLAERTDLPLLWKLYVADRDQQARGSDVVRDPRKTPSVSVLNTYQRDLHASMGQPRERANGEG
jgi:hypothetical protein